jgi:transposase
MKSFDVVAETRRRWPAEERRQIVAESESAPVSVVARRYGVATSLVFRWRRQAGLSGKRSDAKKKPSASFVPVALSAPSVVMAMPASSSPRGQDHGMIEIELADGRRVRVSGTVDADTLKRVIGVLEGR